MSFVSNAKEFEVAILEDWQVTVCAWRGCCLEVFSRAEHAVADCLKTLDDAGLPLHKDACSPIAIHRHRTLHAVLGAYRFSGHEKSARRLLVDWELLHQRRAPLAHGRLVGTIEGVAIYHRTFDGKAGREETAIHLSRLEMLAQLTELQSLQLRLHNQLGQIRAFAPTATPVAT